MTRISKAPWSFWEMFSELAGPTFQRALDEMGPVRQGALSRSVIGNLERFRIGAVINPTATIVGCCGTR